MSLTTMNFLVMVVNDKMLGKSNPIKIKVTLGLDEDDIGIACKTSCKHIKLVKIYENVGLDLANNKGRCSSTY